MFYSAAVIPLVSIVIHILLILLLRLKNIISRNSFQPTARTLLIVIPQERQTSKFHSIPGFFNSIPIARSLLSHWLLVARSLGAG